MKRTRIGFTARWRVAVPVFAAVAAIAAAAPTAAASQSGGSATTQGAPARQAAMPTPMPGYTPGVTGAEGEEDIYYTVSDRTVYNLTWRDGMTFVHGYGGQLIGGPALSGQTVMGRWTDNALWWNHVPQWQSLGGRLTSRPGTASGGLSVPNGSATDVVARGTDGAVWVNQSIFAGPGEVRWTGWRSLGGQVLAGSGPTAVNTGNRVYVLAVGTDRAVWVKHSADGAHWTAWRSLGGQVSGDLGAASHGPAIVFARGADNAVWYNQFVGTTAGVTPGWHTLGERLTSGVGAWQGHTSDVTPNNTFVVVMGADNHIWQRTGNWPTLGLWRKVF